MRASMENDPLSDRPANAHSDGRPLLQLHNQTISGGVVNTRRTITATGKRQHEESEGPAVRNNKRQRVSSRSPSPPPRPEMQDFGVGRTPTATPGPQFEPGAHPRAGSQVLTRATRRAQKKQQQRRCLQAQRQQGAPAGMTAPPVDVATAQPVPTVLLQPQHHHPQRVVASSSLPFEASAAQWNTSVPPTFTQQQIAPADAAPPHMVQDIPPVSLGPGVESSARPAQQLPAEQPPQRRRSVGPAHASTSDAVTRPSNRAAPTSQGQGVGAAAGADSNSDESGSNAPAMRQRQLRSRRALRSGGPAAAAAAATPGRTSNAILDIMKRQLSFRGRDITRVSLKLHGYSDEQLHLMLDTLTTLLDDDDSEEAINYLQNLP